MFYDIKKNSISNYPSPMVNCTVNCFLHETDKLDETKAVYWIPYQINLSDCIGLTPEQIDNKIRTQGEALFSSPDYQTIFQAIELGTNVNAPEVL